SARNYYFDFENNLKNLERGQTPFSPATVIFLQLQQRLREIEKIGLKETIAQTAHKANYFRALCNKNGWRILPENSSNCITSFCLKQNGDRLFTDLQEMGICIMPSGMPNYFRVTHTGLQTATDLDILAAAISEIENKKKHHPIRVFTSGSFDLFHVGHLNILEKSAALGDELIVGVSTDELIESYKGVKPTIPFEQRMRTVAALGCVTKVVTQTKLTEIKQLKEEYIDIVTIGDDWKSKYLEGLEWVKQQPDKKVIYFPYTDGVSTTDIKQQIINDSYDIIQASMNRQHKLEKDWPEDKH
ncbi:MAG: adenylyltransferase/cytidyltransferase family protein, partial [Bacteroidaceae bacterium]